MLRACRGRMVVSAILSRGAIGRAPFRMEFARLCSGPRATEELQAGAGSDNTEASAKNNAGSGLKCPSWLLKQLVAPVGQDHDRKGIAQQIKQIAEQMKQNAPKCSGHAGVRGRRGRGRKTGRKHANVDSKCADGGCRWTDAGGPTPAEAQAQGAKGSSGSKQDAVATMTKARTGGRRPQVAVASEARNGRKRPLGDADRTSVEGRVVQKYASDLQLRTYCSALRRHGNDCSGDAGTRGLSCKRLARAASGRGSTTSARWEHAHRQYMCVWSGGSDTQTGCLGSQGIGRMRKMIDEWGTITGDPHMRVAWWCLS